MAKRAKSEAQEVKEIKQPDFHRAIKVIANDVATAEEVMSSKRGDAKAAWDIVENDCGVNKKAAKAFCAIRKMSQENRDDYLSSLLGLLNAGEVGISKDLVDLMSGVGGAMIPLVIPDADLPTFQ